MQDIVFRKEASKWIGLYNVSIPSSDHNQGEKGNFLYKVQRTVTGHRNQHLTCAQEAVESRDS